jgi:hypothetical protein
MVELDGNDREEALVLVGKSAAFPSLPAGVASAKLLLALPVASLALIGFLPRPDRATIFETTVERRHFPVVRLQKALATRKNTTSIQSEG